MHLDGVREVVAQEAHRAVGQPVVVERADLSSVSWG